ncbi:adenylosuccinate lyase, partial [Candidatus Woesearchaeota archaeon]|nr:adenylosuccinate lyase [Candidatus Woesearchaeota archaeon]
GYKHIKATNHDVKAIEYFMKDKLQATSLRDCLEWVHFALTSEDVNNISYGLMLRDAMNTVMIPVIDDLTKILDDFAHTYKGLPMLARTHGQPASPTTFGKECNVFSSRLKRQLAQLRQQEILVKMNGATGNYDAHHAAYPDGDWLAFTRDFVSRFHAHGPVQVQPNLITTQIEPHDSCVELFDALRRINTIVIGLDQDMWRYISDNWLVQKPIEGEVGSSTMPHKVNPIDFENSEGRLGLANKLLGYFSEKLPISRLQRDLSDSTVEREFGVALAHSLAGYMSTMRGLKKIHVNEKKVIEDLESHPEVLAEGMQTILRREGYQLPYEQLKELTRGKNVTLKDMHAFVDTLALPEVVKQELKQLTPTNYIGLSAILAEYDQE